MQFTEDQILTLAPDESSKKSGKDLANPAKWVSKGANELALWGEAQGSGSKPYQTQIDITNIAFKCSCPSRKFPCKHGIGLLLLFSRQKHLFTTTNAPDWVKDWLNKRVEKEEKKANKEEKPVDEVAQAKRQQARQLKVSDGIDELTIWVKDIIRNGTLVMPDKGYKWFDNMAKRMVDSQAPGLATIVKNLGETDFYSEGWQSVFMEKLVNIYLVLQAFKNFHLVSEQLQNDIKNWIGFTQNQDELKEQTGTTDTWLVLAKQSSEKDDITTEKNWLYGTSSNQYALILQFIIRGQGGNITLTPGMFIQAELIFFPSVIPLRAIVKRQISTNANITIQPFLNWYQVVQAETELSSQLPVRGERPFIVKELKPVQYNNEWWLQDNLGNIMPLKNGGKKIWKLLAIGGGFALDMVVIGKGNLYEPMGLWQQEKYLFL